MNWITPNLAIGSAYHDSDKHVLDAQGISAVLQLYEGCENWPPHWRALHLPIHDGQPVPCDILRAGCEFAQTQRAAGCKTLIACLMGQSRSATFAFACLLADGYAPPDAWRLLKTRHPDACPHPILFQSLLDCYRVPFTASELYRLKLEKP